MRGAEEMAAAPWQWGAEEVATIVALRGDGRAAGAEEEVAAVPSWVGMGGSGARSRSEGERVGGSTGTWRRRLG